MGAYEVIDAVRPAGISAPPTVYRALSKLIDLGVVHRIESANAFVACNADHDEGDVIMLMVCNGCSKTEEFSEPGVESLINAQAGAREFSVSGTVLEVRGRCSTCQLERVSDA